MVAALKANTQKTQYKLMSCKQKAGQNHYVKATNNSFENVVKFKDLGMKLQNQNCMTEEIHPLLHYLDETPQMVSNVVLPCPITLSPPTPSPLTTLYNSTQVPPD